MKPVAMKKMEPTMGGEAAVMIQQEAVIEQPAILDQFVDEVVNQAVDDSSGRVWLYDGRTGHDKLQLMTQVGETGHTMAERDTTSYSRRRCSPAKLWQGVKITQVRRRRECSVPWMRL